MHATLTIPTNIGSDEMLIHGSNHKKLLSHGYIHDFGWQQARKAAVHESVAILVGPLLLDAMLTFPLAMNHTHYRTPSTGIRLS